MRSVNSHVQQCIGPVYSVVYVLVTNLIHSQEIYPQITLTVILSIAKSTFSHCETFGGAHVASLWQYRVALPTDYVGSILTHFLI